MSTFDPADKLRQHRPVLLACEAIGWFHMAGKARMEFLRKHGGEKLDYDDLRWHEAEQPPFPWDNLLGWVRTFANVSIPSNAWPNSMKEFTEKHRGRDPGMVGLLQAGHGMASGIEKNLPGDTSKYLGQSQPRMWLSSPFGHPKRNLFANPPEILTERGWQQLVAEMRRVLEELKTLQRATDALLWQQWRDKAIGPGSYIREAFLCTLAETRLPNNDVTLWDQSYVAAALFKSAVAGAILDQSFPFDQQKIERTIKNKIGEQERRRLNDKQRQGLVGSYLKSNIRWRLLTVAIGADHHEARAVRIGDWTGTRTVLDQFFAQVAQLIEVDLAVGSLLYRDSSTAVFSFPGERFDEEEEAKRKDPNFEYDEERSADWLGAKKWENQLQDEVDDIAESLCLETPPLVRISAPTRSLVPLVRERREAVKRLAVPIHRPWNVGQHSPGVSHGHVCPVCRVRPNGDPTNKGKPCKVCRDRRHHRLKDWLHGRLSYDTIWFEEVADGNNRIALLTFSLDLEPWLNGERVDSLRAQAIPEWVRSNPTLRNHPNPIASSQPWDSLRNYIGSKLSTSWNPNDPVLMSLQEGFGHHTSWQEFFERIVEDRSEAPDWNSLNDDQQAAWLAHQLFRKLPSPGRVYRFWREAQEFSEELLKEFRQIVARSENLWRLRRLLLVPDQSQSDRDWQDGTLYNGSLRGVPFSLVYVSALGSFVTASNLARLLGAEEQASVLVNKEHVLVEEEDTFGKQQELVISRVEKIPRPYSHLGVYHPLIPLELSPLRFRVIVPLEAASECVDLALGLWKDRFARVWDRLPLHVGIVAFERALSFQAVLEAARNLEDALTSQEEERWEVKSREAQDGVLTLQLCRQDGQMAIHMMPLRAPDGRDDVFYPYVRVEDTALRFPRDFRHPEGAIYRHATDLRIGDGVFVFPARVAALFMDSTATRFEKIELSYPEDWEKAMALWQLLERVAPSQTALQRFRSALSQLEQEWRAGPDRASPELWRDTVGALLVEHLEVKGAALETLTEAALQGLLQRALEWHMTALKESL